MSKLTIRSNTLARADCELTDDQLSGVSGGNSISKFPSVRTPKFGPAPSIAQGEINSDQTDNNLP